MRCRTEDRAVATRRLSVVGNPGRAGSGIGPLLGVCVEVRAQYPENFDFALI
jgi:hypothetical protein